jgi:hypothetical protein
MNIDETWINYPHFTLDKIFCQYFSLSCISYRTFRIKFIDNFDDYCKNHNLLQPRILLKFCPEL